jgi:hypothetical protein
MAVALTRELIPMFQQKLRIPSPPEEIMSSTNNPFNMSSMSPTTATTASNHSIGNNRKKSIRIGMITIPASVQVFYSHTRQDRSGAAILDMLMAHAFSWTLGRQYGGVCLPLVQGGTVSRHAPDHRRMIEVLGLQEELPYPLVPPSCEQLWNDTTTSSHIMVLSRRTYMKWKDTAIFTPEWTKYIQQQRHKVLSSSSSSVIPKLEPSTTTQPQPLQPPPQQPQERIIVHIRRGDVTPCMHDFQRYVPNSHYLRLIQRYATTATTTNNNNSSRRRVAVTIYSESRSFEPWNAFENMSNHTDTSVTFCDLKLDDDMALVWSDMLGYYDPLVVHRTLILSLSGFSLVPALLVNASTTTVVYTSCWHKPLPHWTVVESSITRRAMAETKRLRQSQCSLKPK